MWSSAGNRISLLLQHRQFPLGDREATFVVVISLNRVIGLRIRDRLFAQGTETLRFRRRQQGLLGRVHRLIQQPSGWSFRDSENPEWIGIAVGNANVIGNHWAQVRDREPA